ncbi:Uma2 family endonuclease [Phormidesmis priestleyi ULC007]|uniref:Uma2 family endonuclease n=1 Tax=Phormidesmis priestleyi ULC007 TaxID=1920490 RepID=A0A2T1DGC9_9CYAN|nr:Uma2 family endonuclease [Phormidesmis priestleyi]PSB19523.1 Uma2 family endonuclease [Phormidesmis priestleyi ULC007]PZO53037.1 MAG: Uma2 family endonuclease [Phormidesmis priestleyi]
MISTSNAPAVSLEEFLANPRDRTEWVNGNLIKKQDMTAKTGRIQARLARYWGNYADSSGQGGEVYTETSCRTVGRTRCPDVAYLTPDLVAQYGDFKVLPRSFSLLAEVISPNDEAEEVFTKVREYLASECEEVWLVFPDSQWVLIITSQRQELRGLEDIATTHNVLSGFSVAVKELIV